MGKVYKIQFIAGWGAMDFNGHMANRAFLDMASDTRMSFFKDNGITMQEFVKMGIGPVVKRDEVDYYREIRLMENVRVELRIAGLSEDASRMRLRNTFYREDGQKAAELSSLAGWMDLRERKLVRPPQIIRDVLSSLEHTEDFIIIPVNH